MNTGGHFLTSFCIVLFTEMFMSILLIYLFLFFFQLKEKSEVCGGNTDSIEELRKAIYLAEEACPGIADNMVSRLVQRLQR